MNIIIYNAQSHYIFETGLKLTLIQAGLELCSQAGLRFGETFLPHFPSARVPGMSYQV